MSRTGEIAGEIGRSGVDRADALIDQAWREVEHRVIPDAARLIQVPSVKEAPAGPGRPFGAPLAQALDIFLDRARELGFQVRNVDGYAGHVEMGDGPELVGVLCHLDVVPAGEGWTCPPFGGVVKDGRLYGRGACDDKGPAVAALYAMLALRRSGLPLRRRVRLVLGLDEESGWACLDRYFRTEEMPTYAFSPDGFFPIINAEKGHVNVALSLPLSLPLPTNGAGHYQSAARASGEASVATSEPPVRLVWAAGGSRANVVPDRARAILATRTERLPDLAAQLQRLARESDVTAAFKTGPFTDAEIQDISLPGHDGPGHAGLASAAGAAADARDGLLLVETRGVAAHAMNPERGQNALAALLHLLAALKLEPAAGLSFIRLLDAKVGTDTRGNGLGIARRDDASGELTCNLGLLDVSPRAARVVLDIRYPVTVSAAQVLADLTATLEGSDVTLQSLHDMPPLYVPAGNFLIQSLQKAYTRVTGEEARFLAMGGGTYARAVKLGVAFGPVPVEVEEMAHQRDEYIDVELLKKAGLIFTHALWELAR